MKKIISQFLMA